MSQNIQRIREETRKFYDSVADQFSQTRNYGWEEFALLKKYLSSKAKILDYGCGNGRLFEYLGSMEKSSGGKEFDYTGVDISAALVDIAKKKYPRGNFMTIEDEENLPFGEGTFDVVTPIAIFHHFPPQMVNNSIAEISRVIKPGGYVLMTAWHLWNKKYFSYLLKNNLKGQFGLFAQVPFKFHTKGKQQHTYQRYCYWWTKNKLEVLFRKHSFDIIESGFSLDKKGKKRNIYIVAKKQ
jgi:ubiquinone/menaquinone biosynthesis C-methylase UbiE